MDTVFTTLPPATNETLKWLSPQFIVMYSRSGGDSIETRKRFKITLFIRTKHDMRIFWVTPFIKLQNGT